MFRRSRRSMVVEHDIGPRLNGTKVEPMVRIELTTYGLRNRCSTTELHWRAASLYPLKSAGSSGRVSVAHCSRFQDCQRLLCRRGGREIILV